MSKILPSSRPQATLGDIVKRIAAAGVDLAIEKVVLVGIRGYYKKTMGDPFKNDRNLYDDAMFVVTETDMRSYNWNVDPSKAGKGIATLVTGLYRACKWRHKGKYDALQIVADVVSRFGRPGLDRGRHGINFHYGGDSDTWSLGCQTAPKVQYWQFQGHVYELMDRHGLKTVPYLLTET